MAALSWELCVVGLFQPAGDGAAAGFFIQMNRDAVARQLDFFHVALRSNRE